MQRSYSTSIYYLITPDQFSKLHTVNSTEIWHFYAGDSARMLQVSQDGNAKSVLLGTNFSAGQFPQVVVPAGTVQATRLLPGGKWALFGCTVAPSFEIQDFALIDPADLLRRFPSIRDQILSMV